MAIRPDYTVGTVSIAANGTALTGVGTLWAAADIKPGATLKVKNLDAIIDTVNSNTSITLKEAWTGGALSASPYAIRYQPDGSSLTAKVQELIALLGNGNLQSIADLSFSTGDIPIGSGPNTFTKINKSELATGVSQPQGRLSLVSGVGAPVTDVIGATVLYYVPGAAGNYVPVYDGATWQYMLINAQLSMTLDATTSHVNYHESIQNYDVFVTSFPGVNGNMGTGPKWPTYLSRGTGAGTSEVELFGGMWVNKNTILLRFGPNAADTMNVPPRRATLVGSFACTANGVTEDSRARRFLSNAYNKVQRFLRVSGGTSHVYSAAAWRPFNNDANASRLQWVESVPGYFFECQVSAGATGDTSTPRSILVGLGLDRFDDTDYVSASFGYASNARLDSASAYYGGYPGFGNHSMFWLERGNGTDVQTWPAFAVHGVNGKCWN